MNGRRAEGSGERNRGHYVGGLPDDGLYLPEIKTHSLQKIQRHNFVAGLFAAAMQKKWPQRAYVGLYSGAGRARVEGSGEIVETTALAALRAPFTKYIFVDNERRCVDALRERVSRDHPGKDVVFIDADVNASIERIRGELPGYGPGKGLLSFCFVDPFSARLKFSTLRELAKFRMDFLILLALGVDIRRNFRVYLHKPEDTTIADLLDDPNWREEYAKTGRRPVRFIMERFDDRMVGLRYKKPALEHHHSVKVGGVLLYDLVLYSRSELGQRFWGTALKGVADQMSLGF